MRGGYRDRLLTELAQNAADAAARAGVPGRLAVWTDDAGAVHFANTGAALDVSGVHALTALRASGKKAADAGVGQFGVGFTAVRSVSDEIEVRSRDGGVVFGAQRTVDALRENGMSAPESGVPVLRLAWPTSTAPAAGFDTEIVLTLRPDVAAQSFAAGFADEAVDLLLELDALNSIEIDGTVIECIRTELDIGAEIAIGSRTWRQFTTPAARWLAPVVDGAPVPASPDVLRAPTRSDELLSLPALVIADVPMQPDRRRVLPGVSLDAVAHGYADFVASLPVESRVSFVPEVGFARSAVDGELRELIFRRLSCAPWLPGADGRDLVPERANVVADATEELASVLVGVVPDLADASLSGARHASALAAVGVHRIGLARLAEMVGGLDREPSWWRRLFDALAPLVVDGVAAEELAALPVPLADGRTVTGPRTTVIGSDASAAVTWVRLVHPDAVSPLLTRLGAREATATQLLTDPALEAALDDLDWDDDEAVDGLVSAVLTLAGEADELPGWLGGLPLEDDEGELRSADELLLPAAPLADLLVRDSPFGVLAPAVVARFGERALRAVGAGWGFSVVRDELPTGPDHDLDDESAWWSSLSAEPETLLAVRDLDLVRADAWPEALTVLLDDSSTHAALTDRDGYTAWWLRRHARVHGSRPVAFRAPSDETFAGVLDPLDHPRADELQAVLSASICESADAAGVLLRALSDPRRNPTPAVIARTHTLIATAVAERRVDLSDIEPPDRVRTLGGAVVDASEALVIDAPWLASVVPLDVAVLSDIATAAALADVLDIRPASEAISGEVLGVGRVSSWDREPGAVLACAALGSALPTGGVVVHRELMVRLTGDVSGDRAVPWWVTADGVVHCEESWVRPRGV